MPFCRVGLSLFWSTGLHSDSECIRVLPWCLSRELNVETIRLLFKAQFVCRSEKGHCSYFSRLTSCKRANDGFARGRPLQFDGVEGASLHRESIIIRRVCLHVRIVKGSFHNLGRTLAEDLPWARAVDRVSIHIQPCSNVTQCLL